MIDVLLRVKLGERAALRGFRLQKQTNSGRNVCFSKLRNAAKQATLRHRCRADLIGRRTEEHGLLRFVEPSISSAALSRSLLNYDAPCA